MNYKKIFRSKQLRYRILQMLSFVPDAAMIKLQYYIKFGRKLNLENPTRFLDKLQWYKLYYRDDKMPICVDKYRVRSYIQDLGFGEYLNEIYGVYDDVNDIDFDSLPDQFVIKTTDGGGSEDVYICKDKSSVNWSEVSKVLSKWKNKKNINAGREWAYTQMEKSQYLVEKYIEASDSDAGLLDYKFFCFYGDVYLIQIDFCRYADHRRNLFDKNWKLLNIKCGFDNLVDVRDYTKSESHLKMIQIASELSKDFPFVRVDLYNENNKILFGELTFYPGGGYKSYEPDSFDVELGSQFILPQKKC